MLGLSSNNQYHPVLSSSTQFPPVACWERDNMTRAHLVEATTEQQQGFLLMALQVGVGRRAGQGLKLDISTK